MKAARHGKISLFGDGLPSIKNKRATDADTVSQLITNLLTSDKPCMIARYGAIELSCILNFISISNKRHSVISYIMGKTNEWWWNEKILHGMQNNAGFFPATPETASKFGTLMLEESHQLDILAVWNNSILLLKDYYGNIPLIGLIAVEPYWAKRPWTKSLTGKKVLVIHPFAKLIEKQYKNKRSLLFENPDVLPEFNLLTIQAVQSIGGNCPEFKDWFEALEYMEKKMDSMDYDIALIGCGSYGFPLAAHAKRTGHKAVHLAGALQLLFGIRGKRWDDPNYANGKYLKLFNEHWVYPDAEFKPVNAASVEGGCYW